MFSPDDRRAVTRRVLFEILQQRGPLLGAKLKVLLFTDLSRRLNIGMPELEKMIPKLSPFLAANADLVQVARGQSDITVSLATSDLTANTADAASSKVWFRADVWQSFLNPDPQRRRFFHRSTHDIVHFLSNSTVQPNPEIARRVQADQDSDVLLIELPYARNAEIQATIQAHEDLGVKVIRPVPGAGGWPQRPSSLTKTFGTELLSALLRTVVEWLPQAEALTSEDVAEAIDRARTDFREMLYIPAGVVVETGLGGIFWHSVLYALNKLCAIERSGEAKNKREVLRELLREHVGLPKGNYKVADTGVYAIAPDTGARVQLRERVHLKEGRPAETESVYWHTLGGRQSDCRYLVGRIGRHV